MVGGGLPGRNRILRLMKGAAGSSDVDLCVESELSSDTSSSNVATLNPYTFPDMDQSKKDPSGISLKGKSGSIRKGNMIQIYPGQYDIVSHNKFLYCDLMI